MLWSRTRKKITKRQSKIRNTIYADPSKIYHFFLFCGGLTIEKYTRHFCSKLKFYVCMWIAYILNMLNIQTILCLFSSDEWFFNGFWRHHFDSLAMFVTVDILTVSVTIKINRKEFMRGRVANKWDRVWSLREGKSKKQANNRYAHHLFLFHRDRL